MSADETTFTPAHIDAVARIVWEASRADEGTISAIGAQHVARVILNSTDPAVHAAMLDALTRHGVLESTEEYGVRREWGAVGSVAQTRSRLEAITTAEKWHGTVVSRRRLVTQWENAL